MSTTDSGVTVRGEAWDAILKVASYKPEFTVSDVLEQSTLGEDKRRTVRRALAEMEALGRVEQRKEGSKYWEQVGGNEVVGKWGGGEVGDLKILHVFADHGVEAEALGAYGKVYRVGWNARDENRSIPIKADARAMPIDPGVKFDLIVLHPPCKKWSNMTSISGDPNEHKNYIPLAREIGQRYGGEYIIENKPKAPLEKPEGGDYTVLDGRMFGLPIVYKRAFETSFPVMDRPFQQPIENECSPFFSADRSRSWWASIKGYTGPYTKTALAKNSIPAAYVHFLVRSFLRYSNPRDSQETGY